MTWTNPVGGTVGGTVSAAFWNAQVRDNFYAINSIPAARVYHNTDTPAVPSDWTTGNWYTIPFNSERYDTDTIHDTSTNNSRLTCKTSGKYAIVGGATFSTNGLGGVRGLRIAFNGSTVIGRVLVASEGTAHLQVASPGAWQMAVNDYVELHAYQESGSGLQIISEPPVSPEFGMQRTSE